MIIIYELRIPINQRLLQGLETWDVEVLMPEAPEQMVWFPVLPAMSPDEVRQV